MPKFEIIDICDIRPLNIVLTNSPSPFAYHESVHDSLV